MSLRREDRIGIEFIALVLASIGLVAALISGNVGGAVVSGLFAVIAISFLIGHLAPEERHSDESTKVGRGRLPLAGIARVVGGLTFGTMCIIAAVRVTTEAVQASGGERVLFTVLAVLGYLFAAMIIGGAILSFRSLPSDAAALRSSENRAEGPHSLDDDSSADRQQNPSDRE